MLGLELNAAEVKIRYKRGRVFVSLRGKEGAGEMFALAFAHWFRVFHRVSILIPVLAVFTVAYRCGLRHP